LCVAVVHHLVVLHFVVFHVVLFHAVLFHAVLRPQRWLEQQRPRQRCDCQTCLNRTNHSNLSSMFSLGGHVLRPLIPFASYESSTAQRLRRGGTKRPASCSSQPFTFRGKPSSGVPSDLRRTGI